MQQLKKGETNSCPRSPEEQERSPWTKVVRSLQTKAKTCEGKGKMKSGPVPHLPSLLPPNTSSSLWEAVVGEGCFSLQCCVSTQIRTFDPGQTSDYHGAQDSEEHQAPFWKAHGCWLLSTTGKEAGEDWPAGLAAANASFSLMSSFYYFHAITAL